LSNRARQPRRVLFLQTQAELAGAQEISRLLGQELSRGQMTGVQEYETHHLFLYRKTDGCDRFPNVHFAAPRRPQGIRESVAFIRNFFSIVRKIKPDTMLTFQHYGNVLGALLGRALGVPYIVANQVSSPATVNRFVGLADRVLGTLGFYDVITVNSHATWDYFQSYARSYRKRLVHIPHGFAQKTTALSKEKARDYFGLPKDATIMGTVARLHPLKRIDLAIATLAHLPHLHLAIAGQGPHRECLEALALDLGVANRVHFAGEVNPDRIGTFLACLDVFAFPTAAETFGLAAVEAAQAGVPVIANDLPVLREVLQVEKSACALFVDAENTEKFVSCIELLLADKTLYSRLSTTGRELAERYSLNLMVSEYTKIIMKSTAEKGAPRRSTAFKATG
jgi:glycosyltransferase involved in cell wall biosynthesis